MCTNQRTSICYMALYEAKNKGNAMARTPRNVSYTVLPYTKSIRTKNVKSGKWRRDERRYREMPYIPYTKSFSELGKVKQWKAKGRGWGWVGGRQMAINKRQPKVQINQPIEGCQMHNAQWQVFHVWWCKVYSNK